MPLAGRERESFYLPLQALSFHSNERQPGKREERERTAREKRQREGRSNKATERDNFPHYNEEDAEPCGREEKKEEQR